MKNQIQQGIPNRELRLMLTGLNENRTYYNDGELCGRIQAHMRYVHGLIVIPDNLAADELNAAFGSVHTEKSWEYVCGNEDPDALKCWPTGVDVEIQGFAVYAVGEWERALDAAREIATRFPDDADETNLPPPVATPHSFYKKGGL